MFDDKDTNEFENKDLNENNNQEENINSQSTVEDNNDTPKDDSNGVYRYTYNDNSENNKDSVNDNSSNNQKSYYSAPDNNNYGTDNNYNNQNNNGGYNRPPKKKIRSSLVISVVVAVAAVIVGVAITASVIVSGVNPSDLKSSLKNSLTTSETTENTTYEAIDNTNTATSNTSNSSTSGVVVTDVSNVVTNTMPSVVAITSKTLVESSNYSNDIFDYYFGNGNSGSGSSKYEQEAAGSGIIVEQNKTELLIVTNNHVVEGSDSLKIQFYGEDSKSSIDGYIKGTDTNADIAVVAVKLKDIPAKTLKNIKKATLGDSTKATVGEGVIAIGNALGYGQSVTTGVISAKDRSVTIDQKTMKLLQTDAAINGGNSGGALLNSSGQVIGINVAKYSSSGSSTSSSVEGMGFAIPISSVKSIISSLEKKETRTKASASEVGYLGISGYDVTSAVSQQYSMPEGVYVNAVSTNGPAAKAGMKKSDIITKFDGQTVTSMTGLQNIMAYYKKGESVKVTVAYSDNGTYKTKELTATLGDKSVTNNIETQTQASNYGY